jgi:peptide deformylase
MEAAQISQPSYDMGKWPDPILRRPASPVPISYWIKKEKQNDGNTITINDDDTNNNMYKFSIRDIANKLRRTARENGAVGLAAQQCGIDVSMIFLDELKCINSQQHQQHSHVDKGGLFLVNPRIIARSSEMEMKVWKEQCLVLPPSFIATVLRDALVQVQYEDLNGETKIIFLKGEMARALQHELDHDRGILIVDHVGLEELEAESQIMKRIEEDGHDQRQLLAYNRLLDESGNRNRDRDSQDFNSEYGVNLNSEASNSQSLFSRSKEAAVPPANAADDMIEAALGDGNNKAKFIKVKAHPAPSHSDSTTKYDASTSMNTNTIICDEECLEKRRIIVQERRAMMNQSRSTGRSEVFELSKQRAKLYGTEYRGVSCPPGVPCI